MHPVKPGVFPTDVAEAVCNPHRVDARNVKHSEVDRCGWEGAGVTDTITELI